MLVSKMVEVTCFYPFLFFGVTKGTFLLWRLQRGTIARGYEMRFIIQEIQEYLPFVCRGPSVTVVSAPIVV